MPKTVHPAAFFVVLASLTACTTVGGGTGSPVSGSAGPVSSNGSVELNRCTKPVATVAISTDQQPSTLVSYGLPANPLPAMRLIAQQSNCFRIVNRDVALQRIQTEQALANSGQLRPGSGFGAGQLVAADYTIMVEILVNSSNSGGVGAAAASYGASFIPYVGGLASMVAGGIEFKEAQVLLTVVDNHTSLQVISATGNGSGTGFSLGAAFSSTSAGGYMDSDQGKVVMAAMVDAVNKLIPQLGVGEVVPTPPKAALSSTQFVQSQEKATTPARSVHQ